MDSMSSFVEILRQRSSVRAYADDMVPEELIQEIIDLASWAPSAGNTQPWRVKAFSQEATAQFIREFEILGWESALPKIKQLFQDQKKLNSAKANEAVIALLESELRIKGRPSALLIYSKKESFSDFFRYSINAMSLYIYRMINPASENRWDFRVRLTKNLIRRAWKDFFISKSATQASLANFTYALTLAAKSRGLGTCIQFLYNGVFSGFKERIGLTSMDKIFGVVIIPHIQLSKTIWVNSEYEIPLIPIGLKDFN